VAVLSFLTNDDGHDEVEGCPGGDCGLWEASTRNIQSGFSGDVVAHLPCSRWCEEDDQAYASRYTSQQRSAEECKTGVSPGASVPHWTSHPMKEFERLSQMHCEHHL
jgi:hypothetical protein